LTFDLSLTWVDRFDPKSIWFILGTI